MVRHSSRKATKVILDSKQDSAEETFKVIARKRAKMRRDLKIGISKGGLGEVEGDQIVRIRIIGEVGVDLKKAERKKLSLKETQKEAVVIMIL